MREFKMFIMLIFPAVIIGGILYMGMIEINSIEITTLEVKFKNLPFEGEEQTFVQISDIHFRAFSERERKTLKKLKEINPDYIFITGDLIDWTTKKWKELDQFLEILSRIPKKKIYIVFGNHEHRNKNLKKLIEILKKKEIQILNNRSVLVDGVYLIGVDDPHLGFDQLDKAVEGVDMKIPKILLAHSPEIFRKVNFNNVLVLCGHTHGGQINLPLVSNLILPLKYDRKYKSGFFGEDYKWLYVNRGIGWTFLPFRFNAKPEITIIKLKND